VIANQQVHPNPIAGVLFIHGQAESTKRSPLHLDGNDERIQGAGGMLPGKSVKSPLQVRLRCS
jgi:hypothetical protein